MVAGWNPCFLKSTGFTSSTFPIQPDFSQNQPATITLYTGSTRTLHHALCTTQNSKLKPKSRKHVSHIFIAFLPDHVMDGCNFWNQWNLSRQKCATSASEDFESPRPRHASHRVGFEHSSLILHSAVVWFPHSLHPTRLQSTLEIHAFLIRIRKQHG
jgi:hypothetical protein